MTGNFLKKLKLKRSWRLILSLLFFIVLLPLQTSKATENHNYLPGRLLVKFKKYQLTGQEFKSLSSLTHKTKVESLKPLLETKDPNLSLIYQLEVPANQDIEKLVQEYQKNPAVEYAQPDHLYYAQWTPNDYNSNTQWNFAAVKAPQAWDFDATAPLHGGDPSVIVAILDTGLASTTLANDSTATRVPGYDFINNDADPTDDNGHGTHVAATIAEITDNGIGVSGLAFNSSIMPIKVLDADGIGSDSAIVQGISFAVTNGADIINLSLGSADPSPTIQTAVNSAASSGVIIVGATGNSSSSSIFYPARYDNVIAVGATRYDNQRALYSNYGEGIDIVAPGGQLYQDAHYTTDPLNTTKLDQNGDGVSDGIFQQTCGGGNSCGYYFYEGTSMATPHVVGAAALLLAYGVSPSSVRGILTASATDLGTAGYDTTYGHGLLNIQQALISATSDSSIPATSISSSPAQPDGLNSYYKQIPVITLSGADTAEAGISATYYAWDQTTSFTQYTGTISPAEGTHTLYYYSVDLVGNTEITKSAVFNLDSVGPILTVISPTKGPIIRNKIMTMTGTGSDETSGLNLLTINTVGVTLTDGNFSTNFSLKHGANTFSLSLTDLAGNETTKTVTVDFYPKNNIIVVPASGASPQVKVFSSSGKVLSQFLAYSSSFKGSVNPASGDINGDGTEEIITAPGPGGSPQVKVFSNNGKLLYQFLAYASGFKGGVNVASGDLDGDGTDEIVTVPESGGGPQIRIFGLRNGKFQPTTQSFLAYSASFKGGVSLTVGDLEGDGIHEIITAPLSASSPQIKIFGFRSGVFKPVILGLMAYSSGFKGGVTLASGDINGDDKDEIITGVASAGNPQVRIFGRGNDKKVSQIGSGWLAFSSSFKDGISLAVADLEGDGSAEIIASPRANASSKIRMFTQAGKTAKKEFLGFSVSFKNGVRLGNF